MLNSIEAERVRNGMTKEQISTRLGISTKTYYNWIKEVSDIPSSALIKMSRIFGTDIDYLLAGSEGVKKIEAENLFAPMICEEENFI